MKRNKTERELGQGLVEYAIVLVIQAIVVIAVLMLLGPIIGNVFDQAELALETPANRDSSAQARDSLRELRAAEKEMSEAYAEAQESLLEYVGEGVEWLGESQSDTGAVRAQLQAFINQVQDSELDAALSTAENVDPTVVSAADWYLFTDVQVPRLDRSCQYLVAAGTSPEFYQLYEQAHADIEGLPDKDRAIQLLEQILGLIEQREAMRSYLLTSGPLATLCQ